MEKCPNCGATLENGVCAYCGAKAAQPAQQAQPAQAAQPVYVQPPQPVIVQVNQQPQVSTKNRWVAFVLCLFFGGIGVHNFYVGKVGMGILYLFTGGLFGIGWFIDVIRTLCGSFKDSNGLPLK